MSPEVRAERLLRWYPAPWRERYGEEFAELLVAEIDEQPKSWRRTADIAKSGLVARLSLAGLDAGPVREARLALATTAALVVGFGVLAVSLWTQLATAAHSTPLDSRPANVGLVVLSATLVMLGLFMTAAAAPIAGHVVRALVRGDRRRIVVPVLGLAASLVVLVPGGLHMGTHWTALAGAGHNKSAVPDGVSSFAWGETFAINTAWAHPHLLFGMNLSRLGWMVASPLALLTTFVAGTSLLRRLELSARVLHFEARIAGLAVASLVPMLGAATWWVLTSQHDPNAHFRAGSLDLLLVVVMAIAAMAARVTSRRSVAAG